MYISTSTTTVMIITVIKNFRLCFLFLAAIRCSFRDLLLLDILW